ncbi:MAG: hypothetical protein HYZ15_09380 [Sphingobacteriales bacterium]|nr:hypothetical protein [Sphingobacteriales bacterium]
MKQLLTLLTSLVFVLPAARLAAQPPAGFKPGYIVTADGLRQEGFIRENFKSKASFVFQTAAGKKTTFGGNAVNEVNVEGVTYISYANDFFKVISTGARASLLQKVSDATGKVIYNGSEAAGISSGTEGRINDTFIKTSARAAFTLVSRDNLNEVISALFSDCPDILSAAKAGQFQYNELEQVITRYNACN